MWAAPLIPFAVAGAALLYPHACCKFRRHRWSQFTLMCDVCGLSHEAYYRGL